MNTIIAHGSGKWGRANKHKRIDTEMENELNNTYNCKSTNDNPHMALVESISNNLDVGEVSIQKINNEEETQILNNTNKHIINHIIKKPIIKKVENKIKDTIEDNILFLEDIDGWEEKLKLMNN